MAVNYYYIATPFGDLDQACWRLVEAEVGGSEAIVFALRLRGLAAKAGRGGLVALHDGTPLTPEQICGVLGYTPQRVQRSVEILHRHHLAEAAEGGGIRLLDPLLIQHLRALEAPKGPKSGAERSWEYRQRKKKAVTKQRDAAVTQQPQDTVTEDPQDAVIADKVKRHKTKTVTKNVTKPRDAASDASVTQQPQDTDISSEYPRHKTSHIYSKKENSKTTTTVVADHNNLQQAKVLLLAWPPAAAAAPSVAEALQQHGQHGADYAAAQIQHSKLNSKTNPPAFLKLALAGDYAGFYAAAEAKATAAAAKQVRATEEAARQAEKDALLPPVSAEEFFSTHLEDHQNG